VVIGAGLGGLCLAQGLYEEEMLRHGFAAIRAAQAEGLGIPPTLRQ
jgi:hypothetical protein